MAKEGGRSWQCKSNYICEWNTDISCAGFIQPLGWTHRISPPSNPRLDGWGIYITLQSKLVSSTVQPWVGRWRDVSFLSWWLTGRAEGAFISLLFLAFRTLTERSTMVFVWSCHKGTRIWTVGRTAVRLKSFCIAHLLASECLILFKCSCMLRTGRSFRQRFSNGLYRLCLYA